MLETRWPGQAERSRTNELHDQGNTEAVRVATDDRMAVMGCGLYCNCGATWTMEMRLFDYI